MNSLSKCVEKFLNSPLCPANVSNSNPALKELSYRPSAWLNIPNNEKMVEANKLL